MLLFLQMLVQAWFMLVCPINTYGRLTCLLFSDVSQTFFFSFWDMSISRYRSVRLCSMQQAPNISSCLSIKVILLPLAVCQWILGLLCFGARIKSTLGSIWHLLSHKPKWYKAQYYFALSSVCLKSLVLWGLCDWFRFLQCQSHILITSKAVTNFPLLTVGSFLD